MQNLNLIADFTLPGSIGACTKDIISIQKNILVIQQALGEKIYKPGDVGNTRVLVVTAVYNYVCVISLQLLELTGYMSFVNCLATEQEAFCVFRTLCPARDRDVEEIEKRFVKTYRKIRKGLGNAHNTLFFKGKNALQKAELVHYPITALHR